MPYEASVTDVSRALLLEIADLFSELDRHHDVAHATILSELAATILVEVARLR